MHVHNRALQQGAPDMHAIPAHRTAPAVCGSYRGPGASFTWRFPLYICMFVGLAGCFALLASQFVTPTPSGAHSASIRWSAPCQHLRAVRLSTQPALPTHGAACCERQKTRVSFQEGESLSLQHENMAAPALPCPAGLLARLSLGAALRSTGELLLAAADVASGEVGNDGRLALASGVQQGGLDTGLHPVIMPLHYKSAAAGTSCHVSECAHVLGCVRCGAGTGGRVHRGRA